MTAGSGYLVDSGARSAGVDVYDNDEVASAPVKTLWTSTLEWQGDYGAGWVNANADDFSSPGWSEDANECRIWYMAYGAASRELWLRVNADLCEDGISEPETLTLHVGGVTVGPGDGLSDFARRTVGIVTGVEADWAPGEQDSIAADADGSRADGQLRSRDLGRGCAGPRSRGSGALLQRESGWNAELSGVGALCDLGRHSDGGGGL